MLRLEFLYRYISFDPNLRESQYSTFTTRRPRSRTASKKASCLPGKTVNCRVVPLELRSRTHHFIPYEHIVKIESGDARNQATSFKFRLIFPSTQAREGDAATSLLYFRSCATLKQVSSVSNPDKIVRQEKIAEHSVSYYGPWYDFQLTPQICNTREVCEEDAATLLLYFWHLIASSHQVSYAFNPDKIGRQERQKNQSVSHSNPKDFD